MSVFYDTTSLLNISRQQQQSAKQEVKMLAESYEQVYSNDLEEIVEYLISEGYDFSDYTWDELYEMYDELKEASDYQQGRLFKRSGEPYNFQKKGSGNWFIATDPTQRGGKTSSSSTQEPSKPSPGQLSLNLSGKKPSRSLPSVRKPSPEERRISPGQKRKPVTRKAPSRASDFQKAVATVGPNATIADLKKHMTKVPGTSLVDKLETMIQSARKNPPAPSKASDSGESAQQKKTETRKERLQRLEKSGARSRVKARRKGSSGFSPSKETKQQMSASGRYGKRTLGQRIKSLFRKEDIDLFEASVHVLINEGYNEEQIAYILETLESGNDDYEIQECFDILENAVDGALIYQFMIENYDFDYHEDVIDAMEQLNEEDIDYILDEGTKIDRRKKGNKYASKYMN